MSLIQPDTGKEIVFIDAVMAGRGISAGKALFAVQKFPQPLCRPRDAAAALTGMASAGLFPNVKIIGNRDARVDRFDMIENFHHINVAVDAHSARILAFEPRADNPQLQGQLGEGAVIEFLRAVRRQAIWLEAGIAGAFKSPHRGSLDGDMVGVSITAVGIEGDDDLRASLPQRLDNRGGDAVGMMPPLMPERSWMFGGLAAGHAAVLVAQHENLFELEELPGAVQFTQAQFGNRVIFAFHAVGNSAGIAVGGADEVDISPVVDPFGNRRAQAKTFVVRVGETDEQTRFCHACPSLSSAGSCANSSIIATVPCPSQCPFSILGLFSRTRPDEIWMNRITGLMPSLMPVLVLSSLLWAQVTMGQTATAIHTPEGPIDTPTPTATLTPTPIGPYSYPEGINPLTGLPYPNSEASSRRNLIVKISNYPPIVRPQHGVNQADLVFEYEAEGGVTRFAAIFRSHAPARVGSIRSGRLLDMELVTMYSALLAYSGASEPVQELFWNADFKYRLLSPSFGDNCENAGFCRDAPLAERPFEHTLFGNTRLMWEVATRRQVNTGYRAVGFAFNVQADEGGSAADDIRINWFGDADARWLYNESNGRYLRYTDSAPHYDAADGRQLWTDNLVILEVPHNRRPDIFPPDAAYESLEIALWDQGRAYVMREGQAYVGFWRRLNKKPQQALQLIYRDGQSIMLKPGRTWVAVTRFLGDAVIQAADKDMTSRDACPYHEWETALAEQRISC